MTNIWIFMTDTFLVLAFRNSKHGKSTESKGPTGALD